MLLGLVVEVQSGSLHFSTQNITSVAAGSFSIKFKKTFLWVEKNTFPDNCVRDENEEKCRDRDKNKDVSQVKIPSFQF